MSLETSLTHKPMKRFAKTFLTLIYNIICLKEQISGIAKRETSFLSLCHFFSLEPISNTRCQIVDALEPVRLIGETRTKDLKFLSWYKRKGRSAYS